MVFFVGGGNGEKKRRGSAIREETLENEIQPRSVEENGGMGKDGSPKGKEEWENNAMGEEKKSTEKKRPEIILSCPALIARHLFLPARKLFVVVRRKPCKWAGL